MLERVTMVVSSKLCPMRTLQPVVNLGSRFLAGASTVGVTLLMSSASQAHESPVPHAHPHSHGLENSGVVLLGMSVEAIFLSMVSVVLLTVIGHSVRSWLTRRRLLEVLE